MKVVYITTIDIYDPVGGRVFEAFCEYDEDLLEAHRIAQEMAEIMGKSISDLKYRIIDNEERFGAILSYDVNNLTSVQVEDRRLQRVGSDSLFPGKDGKVEWHKFYEIDVREYEKLVCFGESEILKEMKGDVF